MYVHLYTFTFDLAQIEFGLQIRTVHSIVTYGLWWNWKPYKEANKRVLVTFVNFSKTPLTVEQLK